MENNKLFVEAMTSLLYNAVYGGIYAFIICSIIDIGFSALKEWVLNKIRKNFGK